FALVVQALDDHAIMQGTQFHAFAPSLWMSVSQGFARKPGAVAPKWGPVPVIPVRVVASTRALRVLIIGIVPPNSRPRASAAGGRTGVGNVYGWPACRARARPPLGAGASAGPRARS